MVARREAWALVITASVAITPMVVLVPASSGLGASPRSRARRVSSRALPSAVRAPGDGPARVGIDHVAQGIAGDQRADGDAVRRVTEAVPMPPFMARSMPKILPTAAPAPAPTLPSAGRLGRCRLAGAITRGRVRADGGVADQQVEQHRARHDGQTHRPDGKADALLLQPAHRRRWPRPGPRRCRRPAGCRARSPPGWWAPAGRSRACRAPRRARPRRRSRPRGR